MKNKEFDVIYLHHNFYINNLKTKCNEQEFRKQ